MAKINIEIKGISAELVLGSYMPDDPAIYNNWEEFYHYNDLIHESQLLSDYVNEITVWKDGEQIFKGPLPASQLKLQKSSSPLMIQNSTYLRTECIENAVYTAGFETEAFHISELFFETQEHDLLFKAGKSFIAGALYQNQKIEFLWQSGTPVGNICLVCRFDNGYLIPLYDAVNKRKPG